MNIDKQKIETSPHKNTKHTQIPLRLVTEQKKKENDSFDIIHTKNLTQK